MGADAQAAGGRAGGRRRVHQPTLHRPTDRLTDGRVVCLCVCVVTLLCFVFCVVELLVRSFVVLCCVVLCCVMLWLVALKQPTFFRVRFSFCLLYGSTHPSHSAVS